jgi:hypothetical protein
MSTVEYIQVAGKSDIYLGFPGDSYATVIKAGEQLDETRIEIAQIFHDVHGDRNGGPQGPPIERQFLGETVTCQFNMSRWSTEVHRLLLQHGVMATQGRIQDSEVGALILRDRSFRVAIVPSRSNIIPQGLANAGTDAFFYNFPCCCIASPVATGQGTKFSLLSFTMQAYRVPEGHPITIGTGNEVNVGVLWNKNSTLIPGWTNGAHTPP